MKTNIQKINGEYVAKVGETVYNLNNCWGDLGSCIMCCKLNREIFYVDENSSIIDKNLVLPLPVASKNNRKKNRTTIQEPILI